MRADFGAEPRLDGARRARRWASWRLFRRPVWWSERWSRRARLALPLVVGVSIGAGGAAFPPTRDAALSVIDGLRRAALAQPEFRLRTVEVAGAANLTDAEILTALDLEGERRAALGFDARDARRRLERLGWVDRASVLLRPPHSLMIEIVERQPAMLWRRNSRLWLLDRDGVEIAEAKNRASAPELPLIVGLGASGEAAQALALYRRALEARLPVAGLVRVGERRWDLELVGGPRVMLPEHDPEAALERMISWVGGAGLLDRDFGVVDLRIDHAPTARRKTRDS